MRTLEDILGDIKKAKNEKKKAKKEFGKKSFEYVETIEEVSSLQDELDFFVLHY